MRELRTEIEIAAPLQDVWNILTDFDHWKDWNPIVNQVNGTASSGSKLDVTMRGKDGKDGVHYKPIIKEIDAPKSFRWRGVMMAEFLFTNDKQVELEKTTSGTRVVHRELFGGALVPLFWNKLNENTRPMLESMNKALKSKAEAQSGK